MTKSLKGLGKEGAYMNIMKAVYDKLSVGIPSKIKSRTRVFTFYILRQYNP